MTEAQKTAIVDARIARDQYVASLGNQTMTKAIRDTISVYANRLSTLIQNLYYTDRIAYDTIGSWLNDDSLASGNISPPVVLVEEDTRIPYAVNRSTGEKYYTEEEFLAAGFKLPTDTSGADPYAGGYDPVTGLGLPFVRNNDEKTLIKPDGGLIIKRSIKSGIVVGGENFVT